MRLTANEIKSTHRIFNNVNNLVGNYYQQNKSEQEAKLFVSENKWIMFPSVAITSLKEGAKYPLPNVFIYFENFITDNGSGIPVDGCIGFTFNNEGAMDWLNLLLAKHPIFLNTLHILGDSWTIRIQHKVKTKFYENTPLYETTDTITTSTATVDDIKNKVLEACKTLPKKDDYFKDELVIWSTVVFVVDKPITETYTNDLQDIFRLLLLALSLH